MRATGGDIDISFQQENRRIVSQLHHAWSKNLPSHAYAEIRDRVLRHKSHFETWATTVSCVAKIALPVDDLNDSTWQEFLNLAAKAESSNDEDRKKRKKASADIYRLRNISIVAALWSPAIVEYYEWKTVGQTYSKMLRDCATEYPRFSEDFCPRLNHVLLRRHRDGIINGRTKTLNEASIQPHRDFRLSTLNQVTVNQNEVDEWTNNMLGDIVVKPDGMTLAGLRPNHFKIYLLVKDRFGMLVPREPGSELDANDSPVIEDVSISEENAEPQPLRNNPPGSFSPNDSVELRSPGHCSSPDVAMRTPSDIRKPQPLRNDRQASTSSNHSTEATSPGHCSSPDVAMRAQSDITTPGSTLDSFDDMIQDVSQDDTMSSDLDNPNELTTCASFSEEVHGMDLERNLELNTFHDLFEQLLPQVDGSTRQTMPVAAKSLELERVRSTSQNKSYLCHGIADTPRIDGEFNEMQTRWSLSLPYQFVGTIQDITFEEMLQNRYRHVIASCFDAIREKSLSQGALKEDLIALECFNTTVEWASIWSFTSELPRGKARSPHEADATLSTATSFIEAARNGQTFPKPTIIREHFFDSGMYGRDEILQQLQDMSNTGSIRVQWLSSYANGNATIEELSYPAESCQDRGPSTYAVLLQNITRSHRPLFTAVPRFRLLENLIGRLRDNRLHNHGGLVEHDHRSESHEQLPCLETSFNILASCGGFTAPQVDSFGGTWFRNLSAATMWMLMPEGNAELLDHRPNPYSGGKLIILEKDDVLVLPPGVKIVHAMLALGNCLIEGSVFWDDNAIMRTLKCILKSESGQPARSNGFSDHVAEIIIELEHMVRQQPGRFQANAPTPEVLQEIRSALEALPRLQRLNH